MNNPHHIKKINKKKTQPTMKNKFINTYKCNEIIFTCEMKLEIATL